MVLLVPVPVKVVPSGRRVMVQLPAGRRLSTTLPVAEAQVGCVIVPIAGGVGTSGWTSITTASEDAEVHPELFLTVNV